MDGQEGAQYPRELQLRDAIGMYGAQAVMGRPLGYGEIRRMQVAWQIVTFYRQRAASEDWAKWAADNPDAAAMLNRAMLAVEQLNG